MLLSGLMEAAKELWSFDVFNDSRDAWGQQ